MNMIYDIKNIKGDLIDSKFTDVTKNKYFYFLFVALIFMTTDFLFNFKIIRILVIHILLENQLMKFIDGLFN